MVPRHIHNVALIGDVINAEVVSELLQAAVAAADAGCAQAVMLRKNQLDVGAAHAACLGGIGVDNKVLLYRCGAGRNNTVLALDFYNADLAGADFVNIF